MEILIPVVKYTFVAALGVEVLLILRAIATTAIEKARAAKATAAQE